MTGIFEDFGDLLRWLRDQANLSQASAAQRIGVSTQTIGHYESGRVEPPLKALERLLPIYGVTSLAALADAADRMRAGASGTEVREAPMIYGSDDIASRDEEIARLRAELDEANRAVRKAVLGTGMISVGRDDG